MCAGVQMCADVCRCVHVCVKVGVSFFVFARDDMKSNSGEHFLLQNNTRPKLTSFLSSRQAGESAVLLDILRRRSVTVAPEAPDNSSIDEATVQATAQDKMEPHLRRQARSARLRIRVVSTLALALANSETKLLISCDQRPPTSTASTTKRALRRCPKSSVYTRYFWRRASPSATPST